MFFYVKIQTREEYLEAPQLKELGIRLGHSHMEVSWDGMDQSKMPGTNRVFSYLLRGIYLDNLPAELYGEQFDKVSIDFLEIVDSSGSSIAFFVKKFKVCCGRDLVESKLVEVPVRYSSAEIIPVCEAKGDEWDAY